jgi:hypothetical protein
MPTSNQSGSASRDLFDGTIGARRHIGWKGAMPRRPVPATETKEQKFQRLASYRTNVILDDLRKLGSLSNRHHYEYSEDEIKRVFDTIESAVADAKRLFMGRKGHRFRVAKPDFPPVPRPARFLLPDCPGGVARGEALAGSLTRCYGGASTTLACYRTSSLRSLPLDRRVSAGQRSGTLSI